MIKEKNFEAFGVQYRTKQFSAVRGLELLNIPGEIHPIQLLANTEVLFAFKKKREWLRLDNAANIDRGLIDRAKILPPKTVLNGVLLVVNEFNFGFLGSWEGVKVPARFLNSAKTVSTQYSEPLISQLVQDDCASLRELEEYYSLEDAFKLFDILTAKGVNIAFQHEAAEREAKSKAK